jgi:hypothetical protein
MAILTIAQLHTQLGLTSPSQAVQDLLAQVQPMAENAVKEYVGYDIEQATYTEFLPSSDSYGDREPLVDRYEGISGGRFAPVYGRRRNRLRVSQLPLRSLTSVHENPPAWETAGGDWPVTSLLLEGTGFRVDWREPGISWSGKLVRLANGWPVESRSVKVTYVAGLTAATRSSRPPPCGPSRRPTARRSRSGPTRRREQRAA